MKVSVLFFLLAIIFFTSCTEQRMNCTLELKTCPDGSSIGRVLPFCDFATCPVSEKNISAENILLKEHTTPLVKTSGEEKIFTIFADDRSLNPDSISVKKGDSVKMIFKVRRDEVYYGGLDFRSDYFTTGTIGYGMENSSEFVAERTFEFSSYWPKTQHLKATGKVYVL